MVWRIPRGYPWGCAACDAVEPTGARFVACADVDQPIPLGWRYRHDVQAIVCTQCVGMPVAKLDEAIAKMQLRRPLVDVVTV